MEGVTEPAFRDLVLSRHRPDQLGGAFTEFVRVIDRPIKVKGLRRKLGSSRFPIPVGLQLMGSDLGAMAATAREAAAAGSPVVDINFGCPSKGALRGCAGAALLDDPAGVERLVQAVADGLEGTGIPTTAKIRAGGEDDSLLEELARAAEAGGAALLTVHCRTRKEAYADTADWDRLRRVVDSVSIPVCGNGGIDVHGDLQKLLAETGCSFAMVGRAALANPWIFAGSEVTKRTAASFLIEYGEALQARGHGLKGSVARIKQLLRHWTAGGLVDSSSRLDWLRCPDPEQLMGRLRSHSSLGPPQDLVNRPAPD